MSHLLIKPDCLRVEMHTFCRFCRREWSAWFSAMVKAAENWGMLPGQQYGPRAHEVFKENPCAELIIVSDGEIAAVNMRNLGCSGPTNILSFPGDRGSLGTLMLSADTFERECMLYGQDAGEHARRLLAHGMGHIIGFDHGAEMDIFCRNLELICTDIEA